MWWNNATVRAALVIIAICGLLFLATFSIQTAYVSGNNLGPRFFPRVILGIIVLLNLALLYQAIRYPEELKEVKKIDPEKKKRMLRTMLVSVLFAVLFRYLGGMVTIFLYGFGFMWAWRVKSPLTIVLFPLGITAGAYLVFHVLLSVRFPPGILEYIM